MYTITAAIPDNLVTALAPYRQKYDPLVNFIPPHITILKPFDFTGAKQVLHEHLTEIGEHQAPIKVSLAGWDVYRRKRYLLTLPIIAGHAEFITLHDHLLNGPLSPLAEQKHPYRPHIVFGRLADATAVESVKNSLKSFEPQFIFRVMHLDLLQRHTTDEPWRPEARFGLKGTVMSLPRKKEMQRGSR